MVDWRGKVVLVTGGSSGIGRGTALRLAGLGARIAVAARNAQALIEVVREAQAVVPKPWHSPPTWRTPSSAAGQ